MEQCAPLDKPLCKRQPQVASTHTVTLYEYPFHEGVRTILRLEHLFSRLEELAQRSTVVDHHYALATVFEIMDVAARADLKSDLLMELDRQRAHLAGFRGRAGVDAAALDAVLAQVDSAFQDLNGLQGKAGQSLASNDWLMAVRSRINIPAGTCSFDLPAYHAWQKNSADQRRADLFKWAQSLSPLVNALRVGLRLLRDSGRMQRMVAPLGLFQQGLAAGKAFQLIRLQIEPQLGLVPEITGHRLMVSVRFMRPDDEGRLRPVNEDIAFDLALCA